MSNNKQSSVELLFCQLIDQEYTNPYDKELISIIEQAKAMHKEEIDNAWLNGVDYRDAKGHASTYLEINLGEQPNKFYNETYGGNK